MKAGCPSMFRTKWIKGAAALTLALSLTQCSDDPTGPLYVEPFETDITAENIAAIVNIFLASSALQFAISVIGVLVFAGLTAYDTQQIKEMYYEGDSGEVATKKSVMGALRLYLDFINMFLMLLQLFGNRE